MHTRICIQVCKFLEMISKDGKCSLLRPDLCLRWPGWPAPLCVSAHVALCTPASPTPSSPHPLCAPLFPLTALLFSPDWPALSFHHCALWMFVSLRQDSVNFSFFQRSRQKILQALCAVSIVTTHLCHCSTKTGKEHTLVNGCIPIKLYFQNQVVAVLPPQGVLCQVF